MKYSPKDEQSLMTELWDPALADDPYKFVMFVFPWGKAGTPLEHHDGPRGWQRDELESLGEHIRKQRLAVDLGVQPTMRRTATASGRGIGKSAMVAWKTHWMMTTRLGSTTIITANTETQLKTRTFAEITKWNTLALNAHWFDTTVLSVKPAKWFDEALKRDLQIDTGYYYAQGQLWSEENPDAFAGVHNPNGVQVVYDEASGIPNAIFNVTEGFFTEPVVDRYWDIYSNPRRNSGGFFDCFHDHKDFWLLRQVDSRTVEGTDTELFNRMMAQHGADSDTVRVEILGQFPAQGNRQFISNDLVEQARSRELIADLGAPLVMGVDPARFGDDSTVIRWRQGPDGRSIHPVKLKKMDNYAVADEVAKWIDLTKPDAVNIDAGNGQGIIDILRRKKYVVHEVWFGATDGVPKEWANNRTFMYQKAREWLRGGCIDSDPALRRDLTAPEYDFFGKAKDQIMLESKESMRGRGLPSPDDGDAFVLTFAQNIARRDARASRSGGRRDRARDIDYSLFG